MLDTIKNFTFSSKQSGNISLAKCRQESNVPKTLTKSQILYLRKQAHSRKCIVTVGNAGLTDAVINEADSSLAHHELMKIRVNADDQISRKKITEQICDKLDANLVFAIGHVITVYRPAKKPIIALPK